METKTRNSNVWIVILVIVGLIGSFVVGGLTGGAVGWALGRRAMTRELCAPTWVEPERLEEIPPAPEPERAPMEPWMQSGALITQVVTDSPAEEAGLQVGEMITAVDGETLDSENELAELIGRRQPGQVVELTVVSRGRGRDSRKVRVTLDGTIVDGREFGWLGIKYYFIDIE